jgi:hypothetical protein
MRRKFGGNLEFSTTVLGPSNITLDLLGSKLQKLPGIYIYEGLYIACFTYILDTIFIKKNWGIRNEDQTRPK